MVAGEFLPLSRQKPSYTCEVVVEHKLNHKEQMFFTAYLIIT